MDLPSPHERALLAHRESLRRQSGLLRGIVDAHVHLFPQPLHAAICQWFTKHAWPVAYRGDVNAIMSELAKYGVAACVLLVYAHKPGTATYVNEFLAAACRAHNQLIGVGTVYPGEPEAHAIVDEAITRQGLRGIKLHCHVQKMPIDDSRVVAVLEQCESLNVPAVVHAGRGPSSPGYGIDTTALCGAERTQRVLEKLPRLRLVIPHLGFDEIDTYMGLLERHENLYLDTAVTCANYLPAAVNWAALGCWSHRIMYGSDFPFLPYEPDRELRTLAQHVANDEDFLRLVGGTARAFWGMS